MSGSRFTLSASRTRFTGTFVRSASMMGRLPSM